MQTICRHPFGKRRFFVQTEMGDSVSLPPVFSMNGVFGTDLFACAAADAFGIVGIFYRIDLHMADIFACAAVDALFVIHPITECRNRLKDGVNGAERTYVLAEWPIDQNRQKDRKDQQQILPGVQPSNSAAHGCIQKDEGNSAFQRAGRTDQLAEIRRALPQNVNAKQRQQQNENNQDHVF